MKCWVNEEGRKSEFWCRFCDEMAIWGQMTRVPMHNSTSYDPRFEFPRPVGTLSTFFGNLIMPGPPCEGSSLSSKGLVMILAYLHLKGASPKGAKSQSTTPLRKHTLATKGLKPTAAARSKSHFFTPSSECQYYFSSSRHSHNSGTGSISKSFWYKTL